MSRHEEEFHFLGLPDFTARFGLRHKAFILWESDMKTKRMILDAAMLLLLPLLMAYSLIGEAFHEVTGTLMLTLFLLHHWLNRSWWKVLLKGRYSLQRIFQTTLNLLLLLFMIVQPLCGILMSKYLYTFLPTAGMASVARAIHLPLAYWGFVLMSLHAGTHLGSMLPKRKKRRTALVILSAISLYGIYAFFKRQILDYMFLKMQFVFFDYSESRLLFLADYLAVMVCFAVLGYGITQLLSSGKR